MRHWSLVALFAAALMLTSSFASALVVIPAYSSNWSGYVATAPAPFTSVAADWIVPTVSSPTGASSSIWIGIGGFYTNSNKLIQAGTVQAVLSDGGTVYYAWYEVYPQPPIFVAFLSPGDSISVNIREVSGKASTWAIVIARNSITILDKQVSVKANTAAEATSEFILERPLLRAGDQLTQLADFGSVTLADCGTSQGGLASLQSAVELIMTSDGTSKGTVLASPLPLSTKDNSFTVIWQAAS